MKLWNDCLATVILRTLAHSGASTLARFNVFFIAMRTGILDLVSSFNFCILKALDKWLVLQLYDVISLLHVLFYCVFRLVNNIILYYIILW